MPILPDVGIVGSDDIIAIERMLAAKAGICPIEANLPMAMEVHSRTSHPLQQLHRPLKDRYLVTEYGESLGLGSRDHELVDVLRWKRSNAPPCFKRRLCKLKG